jgi:hypothetical protein
VNASDSGARRDPCLGGATSSLGRAAALNWLRGVEDIDGLHLRHLPPFTTLLIRTLNSVYRVIVTEGPEVCIQGGAFFRDPAAAYLDGASIGGRCIRLGWIGVGLRIEMRSGSQRIITSPVRAIITVPGTALSPCARSIAAEAAMVPFEK